MAVNAKAHAGGLGGALIILVMHGLHQVPFIANLPAEPHTALEILVGAAIGWVLVYLSPANTPRGEA